MHALAVAYLVSSQESACSKRKPAVQLTKDQVQGEGKQEEQPETEASLDLKEADAETLKNRRYFQS